MNLIEEKAALRRQLREKLAGMAEDDLKQADRQIFFNILISEEYDKAGLIFCFVGVGREIDTRPVILDALASGKRVAVPKCIGKGLMEAYEITRLSDLETGFFGLLEPGPHCPLVPREQIDFILVPCLSCDHQGYRLGQGGGYYDRYLARGPFRGAALCREQMLCPDIPHAAHDIPVPMVITDQRVYRTGPS
jgi:5-formyltetrahydrofolate cyclo-ligase